MDSIFLSLASGSRLKNYMGLEISHGYEFKYSPQYIYVEIPVKEIYNPATEEVLQKGLRNQHVRIIPACTVNVRGRYTVEVEPNPRLAEYGTVSGGIYRIHPGEHENYTPGFYVTLRKDMEISDIDWAVRLYLVP